MRAGDSYRLGLNGYWLVQGSGSGKNKRYLDQPRGQIKASMQLLREYVSCQQLPWSVKPVLCGEGGINTS